MCCSLRLFSFDPYTHMLNHWSCQSSMQFPEWIEKKRKIDSCDMNPSFNDFNAKSNPSLFCQQNQTMNKPRTGCVWSCLRWSINHHVSISACEMATPAITEHKHQNVSKKQPIIADVHYIHTYIYIHEYLNIYIYINYILTRNKHE